MRPEAFLIIHKFKFPAKSLVERLDEGFQTRIRACKNSKAGVKTRIAMGSTNVKHRLIWRILLFDATLHEWNEQKLRSRFPTNFVTPFTLGVYWILLRPACGNYSPFLRAHKTHQQTVLYISTVRSIVILCMHSITRNLKKKRWLTGTTFQWFFRHLTSCRDCAVKSPSPQILEKHAKQDTAKIHRLHDGSRLWNSSGMRVCIYICQTGRCFNAHECEHDADTRATPPWHLATRRSRFPCSPSLDDKRFGHIPR